MTLRDHAVAIWKAGVAAVDSTKLVESTIRRQDDILYIADESFSIHPLKRIVVVGAGKAGAGMAAGVETALGPDLVDAKVVGWVNVPADCVRPLRRIHLHAARPAGINEPTSDGVFGCSKILELVESLSEHDLCLVLISGGGSALLPAPSEGISLEDKLAVTRHLSRAGANISELNTVRKRLSRIKGGGLVRSATAGRLISLVISDVPGDPLDIIASGPTVVDNGTFQAAREVLNRFASTDADRKKIPDSVWKFLDNDLPRKSQTALSRVSCRNIIIGNNQTAIDAATSAAVGLGYEVQNLGTDRQGVAADVGRDLAELSRATNDTSHEYGVCFIGGGEPVVKLAATPKPRRGGRNQEVVLSACCRLMQHDIHRIVILSGGTDGEDGPTDAAGAFLDQDIQQEVIRLGLHPEEFLAINDSYTFFEITGGLLKTGPTHTNVMDLQIALVAGVQRHLANR